MKEYDCKYKSGKYVYEPDYTHTSGKFKNVEYAGETAYNFTTDKFQNAATIKPRDMVPQIDGARQAFDLRVKLGATPEDACLAVLKVLTNTESISEEK